MRATAARSWARKVTCHRKPGTPAADMEQVGHDLMADIVSEVAQCVGNPPISSVAILPGQLQHQTPRSPRQLTEVSPVLASSSRRTSLRLADVTIRGGFPVGQSTLPPSGLTPCATFFGWRSSSHSEAKYYCPWALGRASHKADETKAWSEPRLHQLCDMAKSGSID